MKTFRFEWHVKIVLTFNGVKMSIYIVISIGYLACVHFDSQPFNSSLLAGTESVWDKDSRCNMYAP